MMYLISLTPSDYVIEYIAIMRTFHFLIMNPKIYTNVLKIKIPHRLLISKLFFVHIKMSNGTIIFLKCFRHGILFCSILNNRG